MAASGSGSETRQNSAPWFEVTYAKSQVGQDATPVSDTQARGSEAAVTRVPFLSSGQDSAPTAPPSFASTTRSALKFESAITT